jgi:superfamily II DNA or RNA helicase
MIWPMAGQFGTRPVPADEFPPGLYELLLSRRMVTAVERLGGRAKTEQLVGAEAPTILAEHVGAVLARALRAPDLAEHVDRQIELCNRLIELIGGAAGDAVAHRDDAVARDELLLAVMAEAAGGLARDIEPLRPQTPLSQDALLVHAPHEPVLAGELRRELASADRVDLLCAFVVWSGVRVLLDDLRRARQRGAPIRVITTTYTGTTDQRSLDELAALGAEVRVSYDTRATRLHAKAWLFERHSGFSTAYVGSSNLSHTALHEGLEWNVRLTEASSPQLLERFRATFETYWADPRFEPYDPERFAGEVSRQRSMDRITLAPFDIRPYPFQEEMLRLLDVERRRHDRWRNLVVAATGTGKTVVGALDYRRLVETWGRARLLFVAHRREILEQSRAIFRTVMRDGAFGEFYVGGDRPAVGDHVFASIQSLSRVELARLPPDTFDVLIIDEFHHAEAPTYRRLLDHFRPKVLLGLTATPERMDPTEDVTRWFNGRIAVELRLWDALQQGLLCPFQYFGISDDVDLSQLEWRRGGYDVRALSRLYVDHDARVAKVLEAMRRYVRDSATMRALGFCVSVEHAQYMARRFAQAGIPAVAISGETPAAERDAAVRRLRSRELNIIFSVDVFNEGLDVPEVDTVLLLRPTESATIFLQQLGRGLRFAPGKSGLTVLDLIGQQHRQFRFEPRFSALTGLSRVDLIKSVEQGFPYLPAGCSIQLDRVAQQVVLENVRSAIQVRRAALADELRRLGPVSLAEYLRATGRPLDDVYRGGGGWNSLRRQAGFAVEGGPDQARLERAIGRMRHVDDEERPAFITGLLRSGAPPDASRLSERELRLLTMLHFDLWGRNDAPRTLDESMSRLWQHSAVRDELVQLLEVLSVETTSLGLPAGLGAEVPLAVHQRYSRDEVFAALGEATAELPPHSREGVYHARRFRADVLFVTLRKTPGRFSPSTMYRDYAISPYLFHWESQSTTSATSPTGQRYIQHVRTGHRILLFARETIEGQSGAALPYLFLGNATYQGHRGGRPMAITWRLQHPLPPAFYQEARAVA